MTDEVRVVELQRLAELPRAGYFVFAGGEADEAVEAFRRHTGYHPAVVYALHNQFGRLWYMPVREVDDGE